MQLSQILQNVPHTSNKAIKKIEIRSLAYIPERWGQIAFSRQSKAKKRTEIFLPLKPWSEARLRSFRKATRLPDSVVVVFRWTTPARHWPGPLPASTDIPPGLLN